MDIERLEWKKNWAGKWSFLECCDFGREYSKLLADHYDIGPETAAFTFEKGSSANFLVPQEVQRFTENLINQVKEDEKIVFRWAEDIMKRADNVYSFVRGFKEGDHPENDYEKFWSILDEYLLVHFPIKKIVDYLPEDLLKRVLPTLEKARVYAEPVYAESLEFVHKFADKNASRFHISPELFLCMTRDELNAALKEGTIPNQKTLQDRYDFSLLIIVHGEIKMLAIGDEAKQLADKTIYKVSTSNTLKGMPAFPGKVSGIVRIVHDPRKIVSLEKGTILVTGMTRPDYLHLFREAEGVVTDAGGVLSHAAITARELRKPTVVGTETATKILKDGDRVEVDAEKGIITILR